MELHENTEKQERALLVAVDTGRLLWQSYTNLPKLRVQSPLEP